MRTIQLPAGMHRTTVATVTALVEMLSDRGARGWVSDNVTSDISDALRERYGPEHHPSRVSYALKWLAEQGYAERVVHPDGGRRTLEFHFKDDTLLEVRQYLSQKAERSLKATQRVEDRNGWSGYGAVTKKSTLTSTEVEEVGPPADDLPPTPYADGPPVLAAAYRRTELMTFLNTWEQASPRAYRIWVDQVLEYLQQKGIGDG